MNLRPVCSEWRGEVARGQCFEVADGCALHRQLLLRRYHTFQHREAILPQHRQHLKFGPRGASTDWTFRQEVLGTRQAPASTCLLLPQPGPGPPAAASLRSPPRRSARNCSPPHSPLRGGLPLDRTLHKDEGPLHPNPCLQRSKAEAMKMRLTCLEAVADAGVQPGSMYRRGGAMVSSTPPFWFANGWTSAPTG